MIKCQCKVTMLVTGRCEMVRMIIGRCYSVLVVFLQSMKHLTLISLLFGICTLSHYPSAAFFQHLMPLHQIKIQPLSPVSYT